MSTEEKIKELLDLDDENFDKSFVEDIQDCLDAGWDLTENQVAAIDRVHDAFCVRKNNRR